MSTRSALMRLVERRAELLSDPVERLQFLQRAMAVAGGPLRDHRRAPLRALAMTAALGLALAATLLTTSASNRAARWQPPVVKAPGAPAQKTAVAQVPPVWPVESNSEFEVYSNGLRIENRFLTSTRPRAYLSFERARDDVVAGEWRVEPAGIVYHTTESHLAPFQEDYNRNLKRAGAGLLEYVRRIKCYHFVIDRFGRVFRVVRESDYANHAGPSVWADQQRIYVNLNHSFFGVAFEAHSRYENGGRAVNPAQVHAGRILTEMLRARHGIEAANCVTHAQVSVNPGNFRVGYHTDWAAGLPFRDLGLDNNYEHPLPSLTLFGFGYDPWLAQAGGVPLGKGLQSAGLQVQAEAARRGLSLEHYRKALQRRYRSAAATLRARQLRAQW